MEGACEDRLGNVYVAIGPATQQGAVTGKAELEWQVRAQDPEGASVSRVERGDRESGWGTPFSPSSGAPMESEKLLEQQKE